MEQTSGGAQTRIEPACYQKVAGSIHNHHQCMNVCFTVSHSGQKRCLNVNVCLYMYGYPVIDIDGQMVCLIICHILSECIYLLSKSV